MTGIAPADIVIVLYKLALENWRIRGGVPASEIDLGFKLDVKPPKRCPLLLFDSHYAGRL